MPVTDEERRERLAAAAAWAEDAPWDLRVTDITSGPRRASRLAGISGGAPSTGRRRPFVAQVAAVIFALMVVVTGAVIAVTRGGNPTPAGGPQQQLVYQAMGSASHAELQQAARIMRERAGDLGVGATVTVEGSDIVVDVPARTDARALAAVTSDAQLSFRPVLCGAPAFANLTGSPTAVPYRSAFTCPKANLYTAADWNSSVGSFEPPAPWQGLGRYQTTPPSADNPAYPVLLVDHGGYAPRLLLGPAAATGDIVRSASAALSPTSQWEVNVVLTPSGTQRFNALATRSFDTPVATDFGGAIVSDPVILAKSFDTGIVIQPGGVSGFTEQQAKDLAAEIGHGTLPLSLRLVSTQALPPAA